MQGNKELIIKVLSLYESFEAYLKEKYCSKVLDQEPALKNESGEDIKRKLDFENFCS